jgi:DNA primase small subunit
MYEQINSKEADFMRKNFAKYYSNNFVDSVPGVEFREFGFGVFKRKIANRNMSFVSSKEMNSFLREDVPLFFSYSNSYYKYPASTPMNTKEWIKADIIYEFDADELGLDVPQINGAQWFAKEHLDEAKKQVFRLLDFLEKDFGFSKDGLSINFSGKAGFHVHLRSSEIQNLNKRARIELVDYLTAQNMDLVNLGFDLTLNPISCPINKGLWSNRIKDGIKSFLDKDPKEISKITSLSVKKSAALVAEKQKLIEGMNRGTLFSVDAKKSKAFWQSVLDYVIFKEKIPIDRQTSTDLHKIIRVPETLHGDTGLLAKTISLDKLKEFDSFKDAVVFPSSEIVRLFISKAPKFSLGGESFGPFENSNEELPLFVALFLIGKGAATLRE